MSGSAFTSWAAAQALKLARYLPNLLLRRLYPVPTIRQRLVVLGAGAGPSIAVIEGRPARLAALEWVILNRLPFPIEVDGLHGEINLESQKLSSFDMVRRLAVAGGAVGLVQMEHELNDSQAALVRQYPEGQPPSDCARLRISGQMNVDTSFTKLAFPFAIDFLAYVHRGSRR